jgi:hypothetical protein
MYWKMKNMDGRENPTGSSNAKLGQEPRINFGWKRDSL